MRSLAIARYHVLSRIRSAHGLFATSFLLTAVTILLNDLALQMWVRERPPVEVILAFRARAVHLAYFFHLVVLMAACDAFASQSGDKQQRPAADLTDTAPIRPAERFFGDTLGVFLSAGVIHFCTLPLLALAAVLSPLPLSVFFALEAIVFAAVVLVSAAASWKLRSFGKWRRTRLARSAATFVILLFLVVMMNTQWRAFRDALLWQLTLPSPAHWRQLLDTIASVPMFVGSLVALYASFILYYAFSSIRALERGQENAHAV